MPLHQAYDQLVQGLGTFALWAVGGLTIIAIVCGALYLWLEFVWSYIITKLLQAKDVYLWYIAFVRYREDFYEWVEKKGQNVDRDLRTVYLNSKLYKKNHPETENDELR